MRMVSLLSEDTLRAEVAEAHDVLEQCSGAATPWGGVTSRLARYAGTCPKPRRRSQSISGTFPGHGWCALTPRCEGPMMSRAFVFVATRAPPDLKVGLRTVSFSGLAGPNEKAWVLTDVGCEPKLLPALRYALVEDGGPTGTSGMIRAAARSEVTRVTSLPPRGKLCLRTIDSMIPVS